MLALNQEAKTQIVTEELKTAVEGAKAEKKETASKVVEKQAEEARLPEEFYQNITLRESGLNLRTILKHIGNVTGFNIIYGAGTEPEKMISVVDVKDVPVWRALNTILFPITYGFRVNDKDLVIVAQETRSYKITLPPNTQKFADTISNESSSIGSDQTSTSSSTNKPINLKVGTKVFVETKQDALSLWGDIEETLKKMLSSSGVYSLNRQAGVVMVTDNPVVLDQLVNYFKLVNTEANKQISVEVKIVEVTLSDERTYGVDWGIIARDLGKLKNLALTSNFAATNIATGNMFTLTTTGPKTDSGTISHGVNAVIRALETQGKVRILSQPKVMLLNNQSAVVQVGTITSYVSQTDTTTTTGISTVSAKTDQVQEGVSLRLMASILNDEIAVQLTPVVTTVDQIRSISVGTSASIEAPKTSTKSLHTLVKIHDGETIAVGGLITGKETKTEKGIPWLRTLPAIGKIFQYSTNTNTRTELVMFISPTVIKQ